MKYRYGKFVPDMLDELDMDELMSKLSDLLLASGFNDPYFSGSDDERTMQALYDAILDALLSGGVLPDDRLQELVGPDGDADAKQRLEDLIRQIMERLQESGYVTPAPDMQADQARRQQGPGALGEPEAPARFEVTDKALDFLGFRALRDLLGSLGKSSFGRHDTRDLSTGIEASGANKPYEFGDTLNLDASATLINAIRRGMAPAIGTGARPQLDLEYDDLVIAQGEYQSSCATVIMLDCSHSMILYGEDRFTPAKRVAMALSQLIRLQYPGDTLKLVLFHDSAEEVPLLHQHARRPSDGAAPAGAAAKRHAPDRHDHRRQAVGADPARRADLSQRLRSGSPGGGRDAARSRQLPQGRHHD
jgi:Ca-activated chloride channel family protein